MFKKATPKTNLKSKNNDESPDTKKATVKYKNVLKMQKGTYPFEPGQGHLGEHRAKSKRVNERLGKYSLTEKQSKVLEFVADHIQSVGFPPTVRQIAVYFGVSAKAAHDHLRAIAKKGYVRLFPGSARGMEVVNLPDELQEKLQAKNPNTTSTKLIEEVLQIPLIGCIAAGTPILAQENIETNIAFPKAFMPATGDMFALRVKGDSMEEAGILDGDVTVLKQVHDTNSEVSNGDIVAAIIDGDATLKTYQRSKNKITLLPQNKKYEPIYLTVKDNATIIGKLVGVYRKYN